MCLNAERVGLGINVVAFGCLGFLYGVCAIRNVAEGQIAVLVSRAGFDGFLFLVVNGKLCALNGFACFAVLFGQLNAAFNRSFKELVFAVIVGDLSDLTVFGNSDDVALSVQNIAFGSFGFPYGVGAIGNVFQFIDTLRCLCQLADFFALLIYGKFRTANQFIRLFLVVFPDDNSTLLQIVRESDSACFAGLDFDLLLFRLDISGRSGNFFYGISTFVQFKVELALCIRSHCGIDFHAGLGCACNLELEAFYYTVLGSLLNETISGDFCVFGFIRNQYAVFDNIERDRCRVDLIVVGGFCLDYGIFAVTDIGECHFAILAGGKFLYFLSFCVVQRKLCTFKGNSGCFVDLDKLDGAFDLILNKYILISVGDLYCFAIVLNSEDVSFFVSDESFRCGCLFQSVCAIRNIVQFIHAFGGFCQLANFIALLINGKLCSGNFFVRMLCVVFLYNHAAFFEDVAEFDNLCLAVFDSNCLGFLRKISDRSIDFLYSVCSFVKIQWNDTACIGSGCRIYPHTVVGSTVYMEFHICNNTVFGNFADVTLTAFRHVDVFKCQCYTAFNDIKRDSCVVQHISIRSICFNNSVFAVGNILECCFSVFSSCLLLNKFSIRIVESELCTGNGFDFAGGCVDLLDLDIALDFFLGKSVASVCGILHIDCFAVIPDIDFVNAFVDYIAFRGYSFFGDVITVRNFCEGGSAFLVGDSRHQRRWLFTGFNCAAVIVRIVK